MSSRYRVVASGLGGMGAEPASHRVCLRCGIRKNVNKKVAKDKPFICGECKWVDPVFAKRNS